MKDTELTKIERINGDIRVLNTKMDNLQKSLEDIKKVLEGQDYISRNQYDKDKRDIEPLLQWVESRMAIEKFVIGFISIAGFTQIAMFVVVALKIFAEK